MIDDFKFSLPLEIVCDIQHWKPDFSKNNLRKINHKIILALHFQKVVCLFWAYINTGDMKTFVQNERFSWFCLISWNFNKILNISAILESKKMAYHILEMLGLGLFFYQKFCENQVICNECRKIILRSKTAMKISISLYYSRLFRISLKVNSMNFNKLALEGASHPSSKLVVNMFSLCTS